MLMKAIDVSYARVEQRQYHISNQYKYGMWVANVSVYQLCQIHRREVLGKKTNI